MFFGNNNAYDFQKFINDNSLNEIQKEYPNAINNIYNSLNGNFNLSVANVSIRQNFIIMDLLKKIDTNLEKIANKLN